MTDIRDSTSSTLEAAGKTTSNHTAQRGVGVKADPDGPTILAYEVEAIPDPNEHQLAALCGGDVRRVVAGGFEHLLRVIARFQETEIALALRFLFDPKGSGGRHSRLRLQLAMRLGGGIRQEVARQLVEVGPVCEFFPFRPEHGSATSRYNGRSSATSEMPTLPFACDIIRREDKVETQVPRELNRYVPTSGFYYSPVPLVPRDDNDYLALDTLLSKVEEPCALELLVAPVDHTADLQAHDKYLRQLRAINGYGDDVYLGAAQESQSAGMWGGDSYSSPTSLRDARKRDPVADEILHEQQEFHRQLRQPQLLFNAKVFAMQPETALMIASVVAECGFAEGKYGLVAYGANTDSQSRAALEKSRNDARRMEISLQPQCPGVWAGDLPETWNAFRRLSRLASVDELKGLIRLPVGGHRSPRCIRRSTDPETKKHDSSSDILLGDDLESEVPPPREFELADLATTFDRQSAGALEVRLPLKVLTKHMFIAGVPGSGKTTAVFNLLLQLHRQRIPFLVIEPAKTEYRTLKILRDHPDPGVQRLAREVQVLTPGNDEVSPLRFNPLEFPPGITLDEHIGQLLACLEAAMPMGGPLQALTAEALEAVYADRPKGSVPQMADLVQAARRIMSAKGYEGETRSNLQAAIEVRLGLLTRRAIGRLFRTTSSIPSLTQLLARPTIIEMDYLPQDHACLLTLFLLAAMREQIRVSPERRKPGLHHVTVIEEAHNIVGRTGAARASEEVADPKAFAAEYVSRMLAELRALGEGIVVADQLPSTVASQVVKNTGTKLAHRLVSNEDREEMGGAMLMGPTEIEELARLGPGTAYLYTEGLHRPRRVRCLNSAAYLQLPERVVPVGTAIVKDLESDEWFLEARAQRALTCLDHLEPCRQRAYDAIERAANGLQAPGYALRLKRIQDETDPARRRDGFGVLFDQITTALDELRTECDGFSRAVDADRASLKAAACTSTKVAERLDEFERRMEQHQALCTNTSQSLERLQKQVAGLWTNYEPENE